MRRRVWALFTVAALLGAGLLYASNMGFKITIDLLGPPDSPEGVNWIALPYKPSSSLQTAANFYDDLGGAAAVDSITRYEPVTGNLISYPPTDFALVAGEGLVVDMKKTVTYTIRGSHDPSKIVTLLGPEASFSGDNQFAFPYHGEATTAGTLRDEIGIDLVVNIQRLITTSGTLETYDGGSSPIDFQLVPGQSYRIKVNTSVSYLPKTTY